MSFEVFMQVWCLQKSKLWWKQGKTGRKAKTEQFAPPHFGNCWAHFDHFLKFISCILYLVSKLGKSGVQLFKWCPNRSWNKKVMIIARKLHLAERKFRTVRIKVRKFSHCSKHSPGTRVAFRTPQANFRTVRNKVRKFRTVWNWVRNSIQDSVSLRRYHFLPLFFNRSWNIEDNVQLGWGESWGRKFCY